MKQRLVLICVLFLSLSLFAADKPDVVVTPPAGGAITFIAYGDNKVTPPGDRERSDPEVRRAMVKRIAAERPQFVTVSGDLVLDGDNDALWSQWDQETKPLADAGIEIFPALGNHDVRSDRAHALRNYFARFPQLKDKPWYSMQDGPLYLLALDSNSDDQPESEQGRWLRDQLEHLPADVKFVVVTAHHPLLTHSSDEMGGHSTRHSEHELAQMIEDVAKKVPAQIIFIGGHVHNYERYQLGPLMTIVSGGGGAHPYKVERQPGDFYNAPGPAYHYCRITVDKEHFKLEMVKLDGDPANPQWDVKDSFELKAK